MSVGPAKGNNARNLPARTTDHKPTAIVVKEMLTQKAAELRAVLPKYLTPERTMQLVSLMIHKTPKLAECDPTSIVASVMQAASLGLDLAPSLGEAWLIPRWNKRIQKTECQFQAGYQGLIKLARQSGEIDSIRAEVVREGETFLYRYDPDLTLIHEPQPDNDAPWWCVYAIAKLANGERQAAVLSHKQIEAIRARSGSGNDGPWVTDYDEMAKKSAIRRLVKLLPRSTQLMEAVTAGDDDFSDAHVVPRANGVTKSAWLATQLQNAHEGPAYALEDGVKRPLRTEDADDEPQPIGATGGREPGED